MPYSHAYNAALIKPLRDRADHGVPLTDNTGRRVSAGVGADARSATTTDTSLRHEVVDATDHEHATRDLFAELVAPARSARHEGLRAGPRVAGDVSRRRELREGGHARRQRQGRPTRRAGTIPEYIAFWADTMEDLFRSYDLDGMQWGAERHGSAHERDLALEQRSADMLLRALQRARQGGRDRSRACPPGIQGAPCIRAGADGRRGETADGSVRRLSARADAAIRRSWRGNTSIASDAKRSARRCTARVKQIKPSAEVGWHVDHQPSSWDLVYRAEMSYDEMAPHSDFIKFIGYHNVLSPRIRDWYLPRFQKYDPRRAVARDVARDLLRPVRLRQAGRADARRAGQARILRRLRLPRNAAQRRQRRRARRRSTPASASTCRAVRATIPRRSTRPSLNAFTAGAHGIVVSREYEEMKIENLRAVGRAVASLSR